MQVNAETLQKRIKRLQALGNAEYALPLTLNEEYQLEAYKMLLELLSSDAQVQIQGLVAALHNETLLAKRWEERARDAGWTDYDYY